MHVTKCLLCGGGDLTLVVDLGLHPLADTFFKKEELSEAEPRYPLQVLLCQSCGHTMTAYIVPPEERYQAHDYSYDSGNSKVSVQHFEEMAKEITAQVGVGKNDLVVDIGSSVGTLLDAFQTQTGAKIMGVEPAHNIARLADANNIPTVHDFWGPHAVAEIKKIGKAKVITMTNAFNHIGDIDTFMGLVADTLTDDGAFVPEVPYLLHLVERLAFDTIYLEHTSYFALKPLTQYFKKYDMVITDVVENDYMGGSMRIVVQKQGEESPKVAAAIAREETAGLYKKETYEEFMEKVSQFKTALMHELRAAKEKGGMIIGIGAATKGNTLMNYCGIDSTLLSFVTDSSPLKVGKHTPGSHLPILPDEAITAEVTHALILPWNIAEFLKGKLAPKYPAIAFITPHM